MRRSDGNKRGGRGADAPVRAAAAAVRGLRGVGGVPAEAGRGLVRAAAGRELGAAGLGRAVPEVRGVAGDVGLTPGRRAAMLKDILGEHDRRLAGIEQELHRQQTQALALSLGAQELCQAQLALQARVRQWHDEMWALTTEAMAKAWAIDHERARAGRDTEPGNG